MLDLFYLYSYEAITFARIGLGFWLAFLMRDHKEHWLTITIAITPAWVTAFTLSDLIEGTRIVTGASVLRGISVDALYFLLGSLYLKNPWLKISKFHKED